MPTHVEIVSPISFKKEEFANPRSMLPCGRRSFALLLRGQTSHTPHFEVHRHPSYRAEVRAGIQYPGIGFYSRERDGWRPKRSQPRSWDYTSPYPGTRYSRRRGQDRLRCERSLEKVRLNTDIYCEDCV